MEEEFDIAIMGRGAAAFSCAIKASELSHNQAEIVMIGFGFIGGTCVNVGCVPSKYILESARYYQKLKNHPFPGISSSNNSLDFREMMESIEHLTSGERKTKYEDVVKYYPNIHIMNGHARFLAQDRIEIINGSEISEITASNVVIATGSSPSLPDIRGLRELQGEILTSDSVWNLREKPYSMGIIGGGYIALELGQALSMLGVNVTIFKHHETINRMGDRDIDLKLIESIKSDHLKVLTGYSVKEVKKNGSSYIIVAENGGNISEFEFQKLMIASGRRPNIEGLDLGKAGVKYDASGIIVDNTMSTSNPLIFAAGDVVKQKFNLETVAAREGTIAANAMFGQPFVPIEEAYIPWGIFTDPQGAFVGYSESELRQKNISYESVQIGIESVPKARIINENKGIYKLLFAADNHEILGVQVISPMATEIIMEGSYILRNKMTLEDLVSMTHIFPTISEGIKIAAQSYSRDISRMSCCME